PRVALAALASPVATVLRPFGAESILTPLSTGCARFARFTRGNSPSPLRGGFHIDAGDHGLRSLHAWQPSGASSGRMAFGRRVSIGCGWGIGVGATGRKGPGCNHPR